MCKKESRDVASCPAVIDDDEDDDEFDDISEMTIVLAKEKGYFHFIYHSFLE